MSTSEYCWETLLCIHPVAHEQEVCRVRIPEVALVGCRVYKSSALLGNSKTSFKSIVTLPTHQQYVTVSLALHLHRHLILLEFYTDSEQMKSLLCFKFAFSEILSLVICFAHSKFFFLFKSFSLWGRLSFILLVFCNAVQILMLILCYLCIL